MLSAEGIRIDDAFMSWEQLRGCEIKRGWFWSTVALIGNSTTVLRGVPNHAARGLQALSSSARRIREAIKRIDKVLDGDHYVSEFHRRNLVDQLNDIFSGSESGEIIVHLQKIPTLAKQYARIQNFILGDRKEIEARNSHFVSAEMVRWEDWFSKIEARPLSDEQVRSVIVMEDRNLLVAAAGSGKTSTIVAKVGYAVAAGYCKPNDILVLSFNSRISEELTHRLRTRLSSMNDSFSEFSAKTFHSFGYEEIKRLDRHLRLAPWASERSAETNHILSLIQSLVREDDQFAYSVAQFCALWLNSDESEKNEITVATGTESFEEAFYALLNRKAPRGTVPTYVTLCGETVRSLQELRICNWLTLMGVEFEYEQPFEELDLPSDWVSGYRPDLFYPEIKCWHEHFGLNKLGKAAPWLSSSRDPARRTYELEVKEKRNLLVEAGVDWFETTSADFEDGTWEQKLRSELERRGSRPDFIGWDQFETKFSQGEVIKGSLASLILSCLRHAKSNRLSPESISQMLRNALTPRAKAFLGVLLPVFEAYERDLRGKRLVDFEDMLSIASDAFRSGKLQHRYKLIMVDEFQDVSNSRAELISALLAQSPDLRLFAVGDDWQSIYRFTGADITAMTRFSERFGFTAITHLTKTFRNNQTIADVASNFVTKNPAQLRKLVRSVIPGRVGAVEIAFHRGSPVPMLKDKLAWLAKQASSRGTQGSVRFLSRYGFGIPEELGEWSHEFNEALDVAGLTIHKSKGLEADVVFLLGATSRKGQDFPSSIQDDPLISLFLPVADALPWAEERRLLYVALTRARHKVFVVTPQGEASSFVVELLRDQRVMCSVFDNEGIAPDRDTKKLLRGPQCPKCEKGTLLPRISKFGPFMVCSRQGDCDYKRNGAF